MSPNDKRPYRWLPWLSALGLAVVFGLFMRADLQVHRHVWGERLAWNTQTQKDYMDASGRDLSQQAMLLAQLVGSNPRVAEKLREAHRVFSADKGGSGEVQLRALREELRALLQDYWEDLQGVGGQHLNVFFAPGTVNFLRMQAPDRYGDSLSGLRPLITRAFSSGVPTWGIDVARQGSGYSAMLPVTANTDTTGGVIAVLEVGMSSLPKPADGKTEPVQMAIFLRKSTVEQVLWEQTRDALNQQNPTTVDDWRLEDTTDPQLHKWWSTGLVPINQQGQLLHSDGKTYVASWWELPSGAAQKQSGLAMLVWSDITPAYEAYLSTCERVIAKWIAALACALLLLVIFIRLNRQHLQRLVQQHGEQLHAEHLVTEHARQRLALALRSSDSGFWEWDLLNDTARFSPEWRQLCGIGPESPHSQDLDEWVSRVHPADKRVSYSEIIRHIKGETAMYENEYRIKAHDGNYKWIFTRGKVVEWTAEGKASLMLGVYTDITERKNTELISIRQQAALHSLNEIASLSAVDPNEQLQRALGLGARYLGLSTGVISQVKGDEYKVHVQYRASEQRDPQPSRSLAKTYCSLTVAQRDLVAADNIPASEYRQHPAYLLTQVETYIGAPLWINGEIYGTLSFSARKTRHHEYDTLDRDFVRLLARWISSVVERWQQDIEKKVILQRFQKLSERLPGFLYQFQLRPDGSSFFPYASPGIKHIYGVEPEDVVVATGKVFEVIHPDDAGWVSESVAYSAKHLTPWVATVRINHPRRGLIWTHVQSMPEKLDDGSVLWHGYVSDITQLKQVELELQETNSLRKAILDAANIGIISTDEQGTIKTFNRGAELMCGYSADEMIDKQTPLVLHDPEELAAQARLFAESSGQQGSTNYFELFVAQARAHQRLEKECTFVSKDGRHFPVQLTVTPLCDAEGHISGYLGISRDISEIKRIDQMKTEFISTVSHELRTPLTAISGALGILVNGLAGELSEQSARIIQIAHNNSQRLIHLVNDLLDMEKLVAGKMHFEMQSHALRQLIQQSIEANASFAQQYGVTYELLEGADTRVIVDQQRLLQVLANYLSNAAKFSPLNDVVTIRLEIRAGSVRVIVTDKGPGVPESFRARLFQKFSQADASDSRQKGGTGLGLSICKEIIERMGGTVGVESTPGKGASFYFELPRENERTKTPAARHSPQKAKRQLLVVEDDAQTAEVLVMALSAQDYEVDCAASGQEALEHLRVRDYDLITLDLNLPDMNGAAIVEQIRQQERMQPELGSLPIVILTGIIDDGKKRLPTLGARENVFWLQKPLASGQLEAVIAQALARGHATGAAQ